MSFAPIAQQPARVTNLQWTIGLLQDQGPMSARYMADITGWSLRRCQRNLDYLRGRGCVRPCIRGGHRAWAAVDRPELKFWGDL